MTSPIARIAGVGIVGLMLTTLVAWLAGVLIGDARSRAEFVGSVWTPESPYRIFSPLGTTSSCLGETETTACLIDTWVACHFRQWPSVCRAIGAIDELPTDEDSFYRDHPMVAYAVLEDLVVTAAHVQWPPERDTVYAENRAPRVGDREIVLKFCVLVEHANWDTSAVGSDF